MDHQPPQLLQLLKDRYRARTQELSESSPPEQVSAELWEAHFKHVDAFLKWATLFLDTHRPMSVGYTCESNISVALLDVKTGERVEALICPPVPERHMGSQAIPLRAANQGSSMPTIVQTGSMPFSGPDRPLP